VTAWPRRVALDTNTRYVTDAGTTRYVEGLLGALRAIRPPAMEFLELAWPVENLAYDQPRRALKTLYRETIWARFVAPRVLRRSGVDLLHRCTPALPIVTPRGLPEVVTLCDLTPLRHPERLRPWHRVTSAARLKRLQRAARIICISRFTADEAHALLGIPLDRLEVVHLGSSFGGPDGDAGEAPPARTVAEPFFLFVGSLEPGKNLALLREAYARAASNGTPLPTLVIVGARWPGVAHEGSAPPSWLFLGRQPDDVLAWLYRRALALVFPSKYEGFGLPILEAMSVGCPVICSRVASLPEVAGEAACYADLTPLAYLGAMRALVGDDAARRQLGALGVRQAARFSWARCAAETLSVYQKVLRA
jgi:glycosyltransferase involved in cell wall biosynthesis